MDKNNRIKNADVNRISKLEIYLDIKIKLFYYENIANNLYYRAKLWGSNVCDRSLFFIITDFVIKQ